MEVHGKDLEIDTNYTNIIFYSFPCQDLSKAGLSDSQIYHCAGDSIVVSVLMGIFGTLLGVEDYEQRINELTDRLATKRKV